MSPKKKQNRKIAKKKPQSKFQDKNLDGKKFFTPKVLRKMGEDMEKASRNRPSVPENPGFHVSVPDSFFNLLA